MLQKQTEWINLHDSIWVTILEIVYFMILTRRFLDFAWNCTTAWLLMLSEFLG